MRDFHNRLGIDTFVSLGSAELAAICAFVVWGYFFFALIRSSISRMPE